MILSFTPKSPLIRPKPIPTKGKHFTFPLPWHKATFSRRGQASQCSFCRLFLLLFNRQLFCRLAMRGYNMHNVCAFGQSRQIYRLFPSGAGLLLHFASVHSIHLYASYRIIRHYQSLPVGWIGHHSGTPSHRALHPFAAQHKLYRVAPFTRIAVGALCPHTRSITHIVFQTLQYLVCVP